MAGRILAFIMKCGYWLTNVVNHNIMKELQSKESKIYTVIKDYLWRLMQVSQSVHLPLVVCGVGGLPFFHSLDDSGMSMIVLLRCPTCWSWLGWRSWSLSFAVSYRPTWSADPARTRAMEGTQLVVWMWNFLKLSLYLFFWPTGAC